MTLETAPRIASCERGFERIVPAHADWTEMPILVLPPPPDAEPFFQECVDCKHGEDGIEIMQDDNGVFHRVKICLIKFREVPIGG